jgi:L-fucose mutarotase/ribose pyranase (RbsD/FucU family)
MLLNQTKRFSTSILLNSDTIENNRLLRNSVAVFKNVKEDKLTILETIKGKSGIYMWNNKTTNKIYIGSSIDLKRRLASYFKNSVLLRDSCMPVCIALLKYGHSNFTLEILEYCDKNTVIDRENHYFHLFKPEYNVAKLAGQPPKLEYTSEIKKKISDTLKEYYKDPENLKTSSLVQKGHNLIVIDIINNNVTEFHAIKAAAKVLNIDRRIITKALKSDLEIVILDRYIFKSIGNLQDLKIKDQVSSKSLNVLDLETNMKTTYLSISSAAEALNVYPQSLSTYLRNKTSKPFKNRYTIILN